MRLASMGMAAVLALGLFAPAGANADLFVDSFDAGASPLWGNEVGGWFADGGLYRTAVPGNFPSAHSSLPFELTDFSLSLDINSIADGGVWLRSAAAPGTGIGVQGVLLVVKYNGVYWHVVTDGTSYGLSYNPVGYPFAGPDGRVRIEVTGGTYEMFVGDALTPATTLEDTTFSSGRVALYNNSGQTFDNVVLIPEPGALACLLIVAGALARRRAATIG